MKEAFDLETLAAAYDRGRLVPFIGSGMSMDTCAGWPAFVQGLERQAGIEPTHGDYLIERALVALHHLRREGSDVTRAIREAIYPTESREIPTKTRTLASIYWPLVCTTNYDDLYCRARWEATLRRSVPRILGRSEQGCRQVLQHLDFPAEQVIWHLQGFLEPEEMDARRLLQEANPNLGDLESELVVGHAEYRRAAHQAPHFRRCFAQVFQSRSFLFLGSGLAEAYFRTLFDEIIELTGPPSRPHFAMIPEGSVDPGFMRSQYHVICNTYPRTEHQHVDDFVEKLIRIVKADRTRPASWSFRMATPYRVDRSHAISHFSIVRAGLPRPSSLSGAAVAISCGRAGGPGADVRGVPLLSSAGEAVISTGASTAFEWLGAWTVKLQGHAYGIVARELLSHDGSSRDRRSPDAIRLAFREFLELMCSNGIREAHVQLLAAGKSRVFHPWVSLVQMTRAYGQWFRENGRDHPLRTKIYVVDPGVIALLSGGHIDLAEQLEERVSASAFRYWTPRDAWTVFTSWHG